MRVCDPADELVGEPQVAELAVHVGQATVETARRRTTGRGEKLEVCDVRFRHPGPERRIVHAGGDDDDARGCAGDEAREKQVGEQKMAEVVDGEGELEAIGRALQPCVDLEPGVADQRAEPQVPALDLRDELADGRNGAQVESELGGRVAAALAGDAAHRLR